MHEMNHDAFEQCSVHKAQLFARKYRPDGWLVVKLVTVPLGVSTGAWIDYTLGWAKWMGVVSVVVNAALILVTVSLTVLADYLRWRKGKRP